MNSLIKVILPILILVSCAKPDQKAGTDTPLSILMADSELKRNPDPRLLDFREKPKWEYTNGLVCHAMLNVWQKTGEDKYLNYAKFYADSMITDSGEILTYKMSNYNIDQINSGKILFILNKQNPKPKYDSAIATLRDQMLTHPRTSEGGFWHKQRYPHQMWLDGLYMGSPFLAQYAIEYNEPALLDDVANQVYLIDAHTYDSAKMLYYHGWDESGEQRWSDPVTGCSPHFWGRAMGWFSMALVDELDFFPEDHPRRAMIVEVLNKVAAGVAKYQDAASGVWWQILDKGGVEGNYLEASCSSMFTYSLLKGVKNGYLDSSYLEVAKRGYEGIKNEFIRENEDGTVSLINNCAVAGLGGDPYRNGSYEYYIGEPKRADDPKGVGPFIMASLLYEELTDK